MVSGLLIWIAKTPCASKFLRQASFVATIPCSLSLAIGETPPPPLPVTAIESEKGVEFSRGIGGSAPPLPSMAFFYLISVDYANSLLRSGAPYYDEPVTTFVESDRVGQALRLRLTVWPALFSRVDNLNLLLCPSLPFGGSASASLGRLAAFKFAGTV